MYEQCIGILEMFLRLFGGAISIIDIMQWVRVCTFVTGNPFGN